MYSKTLTTVDASYHRAANVSMLAFNADAEVMKLPSKARMMAALYGSGPQHGSREQ